MYQTPFSKHPVFTYYPVRWVALSIYVKSRFPSLKTQDSGVVFQDQAKGSKKPRRYSGFLLPCPLIWTKSQKYCSLHPEAEHQDLENEGCIWDEALLQHVGSSLIPQWYCSAVP